MQRRSTHSFTRGKIPASRIRAILEAGLRAPNACNYQSWHFYCLTDAEKIAGLTPEIYGGAWIADASFVVVITEKAARLTERFGESKGELFVAEDAGAAAENMLLAAADFGYNGCFIGAFREEECRKYLNIPEDERPSVMLPIGTFEKETPLRDRKPFEESVTWIGGEPNDEAE